MLSEKTFGTVVVYFQKNFLNMWGNVVPLAQHPVGTPPPEKSAFRNQE
jgi:hypothetical protein